jgi:hypothetical protein
MTEKNTANKLPKIEAVFVKISGRVIEIVPTGWTDRKDDGDHLDDGTIVIDASTFFQNGIINNGKCQPIDITASVPMKKISNKMKRALR